MHVLPKAQITNNVNLQTTLPSPSMVLQYFSVTANVSPKFKPLVKEKWRWEHNLGTRSVTHTSWGKLGCWCSYCMRKGAHRWCTPSCQVSRRAIEEGFRHLEDRFGRSPNRRKASTRLLSKEGFDS